MSRNSLLNLNGVSVKFIIFLKPSPRFIRIVCFHIVDSGAGAGIVDGDPEFVCYHGFETEQTLITDGCGLFVECHRLPSVIALAL